jgi:hypothetical protein
MRWTKNEALLLDTNVLLLFIVGTVDRERIGQVGATEQFDQDAYDLLAKIVQRFKVAVTTPHVMAETSNLLCRGADGVLADALLVRLKEMTIVLNERFVTVKKLARASIAWPLGVADTGIVEAAEKGCVVLSVDAGLCGELNRRGLAVQNFNHLRFPT